MMKYFGSTVDYAEERINELMKAYHSYIGSCKFIRMSEVFETIVNMPAPRFWVSRGRATIVILAIMAGKPELEKMRGTKREMFEEIYRRVNDMRASCPDMPVGEAVGKVIHQPAPKFYLSPGSAKVMVRKARKTWYRKYMQRHILPHCV